MTIETWVQEFQILIAGTIGFAGVVITLVLNAWYAREQRREERRHERQTLRAALIEELKINQEALAHGTETLKDKKNGNPGGGGVLMPTDVMDDAYRAFRDRIGLLSKEEVRKVMHAYLGLRNYNSKLLLISVPRSGYRHVLVPAENVGVLSGMQEDLIAPIDEAIGVLELARDSG